ncbi:MAG: CDP-alcohol phosphatidyltransferase family protein [Pirellulaceae bacterium]|nr:CDP-alcohol phosphatidyltransferase family protein [Planctomycetales bacterium]
MPEYSPSSRRPIAEIFRRTAHLAVEFCVAARIHPNTVSLSSIGASAIAAICFWQSGRWPWLLIPAVLFCYVRLWLNMLDGMVALAAGVASKQGEIYNELPDRISDVLIFVGVAHSGLASPWGGYWAALMAVLTAYVGMFGQALSVGRQFGGLMTKPWRMVTLNVGAWATLWLLMRRGTNSTFAGLTLLDWTHIIVIIGCVQTIAVRLRSIMRQLG